MRGLNAKRTIVTDGANGIGCAPALRLVVKGRTAGIFGRDAECATETATLAQPAPGDGTSYEVDMADRSAVAGALARFKRAFGPTHIAGRDRPFAFIETKRVFWDDIIRISRHGTLIVHHIMVSGVAERGRVVNVASDTGRAGSSGETVYAACKGGVIAFLLHDDVGYITGQSISASDGLAIV